MIFSLGCAHNDVHFILLMNVYIGSVIFDCHRGALCFPRFKSHPGLDSVIVFTLALHYMKGN